MFYAIRRDLNRADRYAKEAAVSVTSSGTLLVKDLVGIELSGLGNLGPMSLVDRNKSATFSKSGWNPFFLDLCEDHP